MNIYTKTDIEHIVNSFIRIIANGLRNNLKIKIDGLGSFSTYYRNVYIHKSINECIEKNIPVVKYISFKPSKKLKE